MKIFDAIVLVGIVLLIAFSATFSQAMFYELNLESSNSTTYENQTITQYGITYSWIYVIAAMLIVAVLIIAFKLLQAGGAR